MTPTEVKPTQSNVPKDFGGSNDLKIPQTEGAGNKFNGVVSKFNAFVFVVVIGVALVIAITSDHENKSKNNKPDIKYQETYSSSIKPKQANSNPQAVINELKPAEGKNKLLSLNEIYYCLAEDARLESGKTILSQMSNLQIAKYNKFVSDYNSRCANFKYSKSNFYEAKKLVNVNRSSIEIQGVSRLTEASTKNTNGSNISKSIPKPDETVREIQRKLTVLGYSPGTIDGYMGKNTRSAIVKFQNYIGVNKDGKPTSDLLKKINDKISNPLTEKTRSKLIKIDKNKQDSIKENCSYYKVNKKLDEYDKCIQIYLKKR